jgi:HSP20 family protein
MLMRTYRTSPWRELSRMRREMDQLLGTRPTTRSWTAAPSYPAMNVWTNEDGAIVTAELPGVKVEDLDISVVGDTLTLRGTRERGEQGDGVTYHRRERGTGSFARTLNLSFQVESDEVEAVFEKGVLQINLPRAEEDKPKKITVKAG